MSAKFFKAVVNHLEEFLVSGPGLDLQTTILVAGISWSSPSKIRTLINQASAHWPTIPKHALKHCLRSGRWSLIFFGRVITIPTWDNKSECLGWPRRHAVVCCQNRLSAGDDYGASNSRLNGCVDPLVLRLRMCLWLATSVSTGSRPPSTSWWKGRRQSN